MPRDIDGEYEIVEPVPTSTYTYQLQPTSYVYGAPRAPARRHPFFSREELKHIGIAVAVLIVAFTIVIRSSYDTLATAVLVAALSVVAGFFVHEMAHKVVARRYGCWAEFRADYTGLLIALVMSFVGFLFAAPGAVYIAGNVTREQNGKISLAGPASNLVVAVACAPIALMTLSFVPDAVSGMAYGLYFFSTFLALFNMVPLGPLDGRKIWAWNKPIYIASMAACVTMFLLALTL